MTPYQKVWKFVRTLGILISFETPEESDIGSGAWKNCRARKTDWSIQLKSRHGRACVSEKFWPWWQSVREKIRLGSDIHRNAATVCSRKNSSATASGQSSSGKNYRNVSGDPQKFKHDVVVPSGSEKVFLPQSLYVVSNDLSNRRNSKRSKMLWTKKRQRSIK